MFLLFKSRQRQLLTLIFSLIAVAVSSFAVADDEERTRSIGYEADKLQHCVAPTEYRDGHW